MVQYKTVWKGHIKHIDNFFCLQAMHGGDLFFHCVPFFQCANCQHRHFFASLRKRGVTSVGWQITLCDPIDKWRPVVLRWIARRTIRSFRINTERISKNGDADVISTKQQMNNWVHSEHNRTRDKEAGGWANAIGMSIEAPEAPTVTEAGRTPRRENEGADLLVFYRIH